MKNNKILKHNILKNFETGVYTEKTRKHLRPINLR